MPARPSPCSSARSSRATSTVACSVADIQQHTTYSHDPAQRVTVTRRHHPLRGQALDVVKRGRTQIVVRLGDGTSMRLPRAWTDVDEAPSQLIAESIFTADALRALIDLVDALRARDRH